MREYVFWSDICVLLQNYTDQKSKRNKKRAFRYFLYFNSEKHLKPVLKDQIRLIDFKRKTKCSFRQKRKKIKPVNQISMLREDVPKRRLQTWQKLKIEFMEHYRYYLVWPWSSSINSYFTGFIKDIKNTNFISITQAL